MNITEASEHPFPVGAGSIVGIGEVDFAKKTDRIVRSLTGVQKVVEAAYTIRRMDRMGCQQLYRVVTKQGGSFFFLASDAGQANYIDQCIRDRRLDPIGEIFDSIPVVDVMPRLGQVHTAVVPVTDRARIVNEEALELIEKAVDRARRSTGPVEISVEDVGLLCKEIRRMQRVQSRLEGSAS